ncbi:hypothetical protein M8J76_003084 [Diaphorina citri]|nr:hypothetical protein M8J75_012798 [Diaphorina citri]KAI5744527.1 hypothetical protein M8J76_003084 [Diaphorina citri]
MFTIPLFTTLKYAITRQDHSTLANNGPVFICKKNDLTCEAVIVMYQSSAGSIRSFLILILDLDSAEI